MLMSNMWRRFVKSVAEGVFRRTRRSGRHAGRRRTPARFAPAQVLESRQLLAMSVTLAGSAVSFVGDTAADSLTLTVDSNGWLTHNLPLGGNLVSPLDFDSATAGVQSRQQTGASLTIDAGGGADFIDASALTISIQLMGGGGNDTLLAGTGNDTVQGGAGDDSIVGNFGNDSLFGDFQSPLIYGTGHDTLLGGDGDDQLFGDSPVNGGDFLTSGGNGDDLLDGGAGNDNLRGFGGFNTLRGGAGQDGFEIVITASEAIFNGTTLTLDGVVCEFSNLETTWGVAYNIIYGSHGANLIDFSPFTYGLIMQGLGGNDTLRGGTANDTIYGGSGADSIDGNAGNDQLFGDGGPTAGEPLVIGDDTLRGGLGHDRLEGDGGLMGEPTDDNLLDGGEGDDLLIGSRGLNAFVGGPGADFFQQYVDTNAVLTASGLQRGAVLRSFSDIESGELHGNDEPNVLDFSLFTGNVTIIGNRGDDFISGGSGHDWLFGDGHNSVGSQMGTNGNDTLFGGAGNDRLDGDYWYFAGGQDELHAGPGQDTLYGYGGDDLFRIQHTSVFIGSNDGFNDVTFNAGYDRLELQAGGVHLNLVPNANDRIYGVEEILLTGTGDNILSVNLESVLSSSDVDETVVVHRNVGDVVNMGGGWTLVGNETINGAPYTVFTQAAATLKIQTVPEFDAGPNRSAVEGDVISLASATYVGSTPPEFSITVNWGDGTIEPGVLIPNATGGTLSNTHVYADNGVYTVLITIHDGTNTLSDSFVATLSNAAPVAAPIQGDGGVRGQSRTFAVDFTDAGLADTHTASFFWGDNTSTPGTVSGGVIRANHVYTAIGTYALVVTVTDDDGGTVTVNKTITVDDVMLRTFRGLMALWVGGTTGPDNINITGGPNTVGVSFNGVFRGSFSPTGPIFVFGQAGNDTMTIASGVLLPTYLYGGEGHDTLTGGGGDDVLSGDAGNDSLVGGSGNDSYAFDADDVLGSDTVNDTSGIDTLDFVATSQTALTVNLGSTALQTVAAGKLSLTLTSATSIENVIGGSQADSLTGNSLANRLGGNGGNDLLVGLSGNDVYTFDLDSDQGTDTLDEAGGGTDTLDFSSTQSVGVTVDLAVASAQTVAPGRLILILGSGSTLENVIGGDGDDSLVGNTLGNALTGGPGKDTLTGRAGNDSYRFDADSPLGIDTLVEIPSAGTDLIDFTDTSTAVQLDLSLATSQVVNAHLSLVLQDPSAFENATGGSGADTLWGNGQSNLLTGGAGNDTLQGREGADSLMGGLGDDSLVGGLGNDSYISNANSALGSDVLVEMAGEGVDQIDFATTTTKAVVLNLGLTTPQAAATGTLTLTLSAADTFEGAIGGSLADTLQGNSLANTLEGGPGNDTLTGGPGDDVYRFNANSALGTDTLVEVAVAGGSDTLDFSQTTSQSITVNLATAASQVVNANLSLVLGASDVFENASGGWLNDTLTGNSLNNRLQGQLGNDTLAGGAGQDTLEGGAGNDLLQGGTENDTYLFDADLVLGSDTLTELAAGGIDTLDLRTTSTKSLTVNLGSAASQTVVSGNLTFTLNAFDTFENVLGGDLHDTLTGNSLANRLEGHLGNDSLTGGAGNDSLVGGAGNDTYLFNTNSALGADLVDESAGGIDTLDFSPSTTLGNTVDLSQPSGQTVNANLTLVLAAGDTIENVTGGSQNDTLTGNSLANTLTGNGGNDTLTGGAGNDSLIGGLGDDTYLFAANSALGTDTLNESAGGLDTLDFTATTADVTLNLTTSVSQVVNPNLSLVLGSATTFEHAIGGSANDQLIGNTLANTLTGNGGNDTLTGLAGNDSLLGGQGDDTYVFTANSQLNTDTVTELPGLGFDLLDFSATTVAITLNLGLGIQVVNPNLTLTFNQVGTIEMLIGSSAGDTLTGNSAHNVIFGGAGNDTISGLGSRDILFGGSGNDSLNGGEDEDIVIGGLTTYLNETTKVLDRPAILAIWEEWRRVDLAYANRITNLKNGGGLNGQFRLNSMTVLTDTSAMADTLTGGLSLDWFWQFTGDVISDLHAGGTETVN